MELYTKAINLIKNIDDRPTLQVLNTKGLFTWREEDLSTRKILKGETNFHWFTCKNFGRGGYCKSNKTVGL